MLGLAPALDEVAERYAVTGLHVEVSVEGAAVPDLTPEVASAVYAIVSEAIRNVHRHAGASKCTVDIEVDDLMLTVADDGAGIPDDAYPGVGVTSMEERTEAAASGSRPNDPAAPSWRSSCRDSWRWRPRDDQPAHPRGGRPPRVPHGMGAPIMEREALTGGIRADNAPPRASRSSKHPNACSPTCHNPLAAASTFTPTVLLAFTRRCPSPEPFTMCRSTENAR